MDPPERELTYEDEKALRNSYWFQVATCQDDQFLIRFYMHLCMILYNRRATLTGLEIRSIELWIETLQSNFKLRGMKVTVDVRTVIVLTPAQQPMSLN